MGVARIRPTDPAPAQHTGLGATGAADLRAGHAAAPRLDGARAALAGGIWALLLYSLCVVLHIGVRYPSGGGMLSFWNSILPGFNHSSMRDIALGFPLAFLYGAVGAWLFAGIYNIASSRKGEKSGAS